CADGWLALEAAPDTGESVRRVNGGNLESRCLEFAIAFVRGRADASRFTIRLRATGPDGETQVRGAIRVRSPARGWTGLLDHHFAVEAGRWTNIVVPLLGPPLDREELEVDLQVPPGSEALVSALALE